MTLPTLPASTHAVPTRLSGLDGRVVVLLALSLGVSLLVLGSRSLLAVAVVVLATLLLAGYAAWRWPLPTLVAATLVTLADEEFTPLVLPEGVSLGPIGLSEPLLLVVGGVLGVAAIRRGTLVDALRDPVLAIAGLWVVVAVVSALANGVPPGVAALGMVMTMDALALFVLARTLRTGERGAGTAVAGIVATVGAIAVFGIAQVVIAPTLFGFASFTGRFGEGVRITSMIGNPNMLAAVLGVAIPFALYGSRHLRDPRWRWAARITLFLLVLALLLTFSRGGWLAIGLGVAIGALMVDPRSLVVWVLVIVLAWGATLVLPRNVGLTLLGLDPDEFGGSIIGSTVDRLDSLGGGNDVRTRYLLDGIRIISDRPILGVGPGRYGGAAATITDSPIYEEYDATLFRFRTVHNFWLHLTGETGAIGAAVFLTMIVALIIRFVLAARRLAGAALVITAGTATMLVVVSLHSVTEMIFEGNMPAFLLWLVVGVASGLAPNRALFRR